VLCSPITVSPFPLICDAAYHQHARGGPSHGHRQHAQKIWCKDRTYDSKDIFADKQKDRHTDRHTHQYFATAPVDEVMNNDKESKHKCTAEQIQQNYKF